MTIAPGIHEGVHGCAGGVVAQDAGQGIDEHRLAVRAGSVQEEQGVGTGCPGQAVPRHALQVLLQKQVAAGHVVQERFPLGTVPLWGGRRNLGHAVCTVVRTRDAHLEVHHTTGGVEQEQICVPLLSGGCMAAIGPGHAIDTTHCATGEQLGRQAMRVHFECGLTADGANEVMGHQGLIGLPAATSPYQPLPPSRAIAPLVCIARRERQRQCIIGRPDRGVLRRHGLGSLHAHARPRGNERGHIKALGQCIGSVPAISLVIGRQEHIAGMRTRIQDSLRRRHGVLPAWLVSVGPDQNGFAFKR